MIRLLAPLAAALWVLVLARLLVRATSRAQQMMTATVACLAGSVTLNVPAIWREVISLGGERTVIVADHLLTMAVETLILLFVHEIRGRGIGRRAITAAAVALTSITAGLLLLMGPTSEAIKYDNVVLLYPAGWPWLAYWTLTIAFGLWAFGSGARFYWSYPRQASARGEALGIVLIGAGTTIALLITVLRAGIVLSAPLERMRVWDGWAIPTATALALVVFTAIMGGLMSRTIASWWSQARDRRACRRSLIALEPLWRVLTATVPNIALDHSAMISLMGPRLSARDKLYRRVIEINDGLLALSSYTSAPLREQALDQALTAGESHHRAEVVADTVALHVSLGRYRARSPVAQPSTHLVTRQAGDFSAEVHRLSELAWASAHCPLTAQITQRTQEMESA